MVLNLKIRPQREVIHQHFIRLSINRFSKPFPEEEFTKAEKELHSPVTCGEMGHSWLWRRMCTTVLRGYRRVGRQPAPFPGLLPAPCQHGSEGQSCSGAGSQPACRQEAACPSPTCPRCKPAPTLSSAQLPSEYLCFVASFYLRIPLCTRPLPTSQPPFSHPFCTPTSKHVFT